jgi:hypothetical protein
MVKAVCIELGYRSNSPGFSTLKPQVCLGVFDVEKLARIRLPQVLRERSRAVTPHRDPGHGLGAALAHRQQKNNERANHADGKAPE